MSNPERKDPRGRGNWKKTPDRRGYFGDPEGHRPDVEMAMRNVGLSLTEFEDFVVKVLAANPDKIWTDEERVQVIMEWMLSRKSDPKP